jgi:hypothetical protein
LDAGLAAMRADLDRRQQAIDNPQEYARFSQICDGAAQRLLQAPDRGRGREPAR